MTTSPGQHRFLGARAGAGVLASLAVTLAACSGGDGVNIGSGQAPDPVAVDFPIAYVKRPLADPMMDIGTPSGDLRELETFNIGADLYVRDRASPSAPEINVTGEVTEGMGDVRDVELSWDGTKVLFAMRGPFDPNLDEDEQPTWNIWEYDIELDFLRRVIDSDIRAEEGHDVAPHYLPDGRIVFTSTRQRTSKAVLLDESKPQFEAMNEDGDEPAFVLHVMNDDGTDVRQISFNQSHDLDPTVLPNGQIAFTRWDNAGPNDAMHLYRANPDGSGLELLYGANSHDTGVDDVTIHFARPRPAEDGRLMVLARPYDGSDEGGEVLYVDVDNYVENTQPTAPNIGALSGPAQEAVTGNDVRIDGTISPGGYYSGAFPLWDGTGRVLVSWSQCRLIEDDQIVPCTETRLADPDATPAPPIFGLFMYDPAEPTQLPIVPPEEGFVITDVVAAQPRPLPPVILDGVPGLDLDPDWVAENVGVINIRSVYDVNGVDITGVGIANLADPAQATADQRPARFLRVEKAVSQPDEDELDIDIPGTAFGRAGNLGMREILGYAPIEPDGSVRVKVPANVAFQISVLDADGHRISPRHHNWLQVRPGEELTCNGCHDPASGLSHGRSDAFDSAWGGAQSTGEPFPNTDPAIFADFGETMAEARTRVSCSNDNCAALSGTLDVIFEDVWTDETAAGRAPDAPFELRYRDLDTVPPTTQSCLTSWSANCRSVIHYETHIHPLWEKPRIVLDADGITVLADNTCVTCHSPTDAMGAPQVPAGQLDLTGAISADEPDHLVSFRELLFADNAQEVDMGALQDILVEVGIDPDTGDPIFETITVPPSLTPAGANASDRFFGIFAPGGSHFGWLTPAELRLVGEWIDIGGQYYNDPFAVPQD